MEWVLKKIPSKLDGQLHIDDNDSIHSNAVFILITSFFKNCSINLKPKIMQDIIMLIKWNQNNCNVLLENEDFLCWLFELVIQEQLVLFESKDPNHSIVKTIKLK